MSKASKVFFGVSCLTAATIIGYVHFKQSYDRYLQIFCWHFAGYWPVMLYLSREMLHQGVAENLARQNMGKTQNTFMLQQQKDLTKKLQREQNEAMDSRVK
jgi:PET assembly of cytochrome c oxidase, mitochondrial